MINIDQDSSANTGSDPAVPENVAPTVAVAPAADPSVDEDDSAFSIREVATVNFALAMAGVWVASAINSFIALTVGLGVTVVCTMILLNLIHKNMLSDEEIDAMND